jgi:hypothetical protein
MGLLDQLTCVRDGAGGSTDLGEDSGGKGMDQLTCVRLRRGLSYQLTCVRWGGWWSRTGLSEVGWLVEQLTCVRKVAGGAADLCQVGWLLDQLNCVRWGGWWIS